MTYLFYRWRLVEKKLKKVKKNRSTENEKKNQHNKTLHKPYTPRVSSEVQ